MAQVWVEDGAGNGYWMDDGSTDNIDVGGGWNPAAGYNSSTAADNIDVGGGWNPATGKGDAATAAAAAATGVTNQSGYDTGTWNPSAGLNLSGLLNSIPSALKGLVTKSSDGSLDFAKILPLMAGLYGASQSGNNTQKAGYQGGIPRYTATRHTPDAKGRLSGNVSFAPYVAPAAAAPVQAAKGGLLESGGFVIPADVVSHLGNGSSEAGLRILAARLGATPIRGRGDGMSDSIPATIDGHQPARVANEEARLTKEQVQAAGGAKKLYAMMDRIRKARTGSTEQGKQINPNKFVPGGSVPSYAPGGTTTLPAGTTGTESSLSNWAGEYVTDMLGKGRALAEMPYEQYQGPLTAGPSQLQSKVFGGLQNTQFPGVLGQSFTNTTAPTLGADGQPAGGGGIAATYMNPYLKNVLDPQLEEMRRQAQINNLSSLGSLTKSGAFGGGRQAIMESEAARNLLTEQNKTIGQGYANAYDKAMQQFNAEQGQAKTLVDTLAQQGQTQQGLTAADVAAEKAQFEEARVNPYKMVQFQQSLLSGLPLAAQTYNQAPTDNLTQFAQSANTVSGLLKALGQTPT